MNLPNILRKFIIIFLINLIQLTNFIFLFILLDDNLNQTTLILNQIDHGTTDSTYKLLFNKF
jgi:hypothetical protein